MTTFTYDDSQIPGFDALNTAHWPADQRIQFAKAVEGIEGAAWFRQAFASAPPLVRERLATATAFAAFSEIRKRLRLVPDEELMQDQAGLSAPAASAALPQK